MFATASSIVAGIALLAVIGVESGGLFLLKVTTGGAPANDLQKSFYRAGHAHAGVLVILGLVMLLVTNAAGLGLLGLIPAIGVLVAALLIPGGFFLSVRGVDPAKPSRAIALLRAGVVVLTLALATGGIMLIVAGATA
jgi:hypothetical protein